MAERNPYLILGVDFGASREEARKYFAHAARRLRKQGGIWSRADLTWALHEIESLEANPADTVTMFRVPADPGAFEPVGDGLYRPAPIPLARRTEPSDEGERAALAEQAGHALLWSALYASGRRPDASSDAYRFQEESDS